MGGDDLGSDDDFLTTSVRAEEDDSSVEETAEKSSSKRQRSDKEDSKGDNDADAPPTKKRNVLLETSRNILELSREEQALFLSAALKHYTNLSLEEGAAQKSTEKQIPSVKRLTKCLAEPKSTSPKDDSNNSFLDRLLTVASKNRLKKHTVKGSPSILIICQSARRAVAVLKELAPLNAKAAKLFPKQAPLQQQIRELSSGSNKFALAVGTPQRVLDLLDHSALTLDATQLVVLDGATSNKNFTVCTLPDTAQSCMNLVHQHILPKVLERKDCKLAFC